MNTDPRITKAFNRIQQILDTKILEEANHHPLQESALIETLIRLDEILGVTDKAGKRVSFTDDVKLFPPKIRDITDTVHRCRHAVCHVRSTSQFADSKGLPKGPYSPVTPSDYYVEFNAAWNKGVLFDSTGLRLESDYDGDAAFFYGPHRLYLKRHIIRAFEEAKSALGF
jgi:hypothetical protein